MQRKTTSFHHLLKEFRLQRNWTQAQVAEKIGTTNLNVSRWERGTMLPNLYFRQQLCELFEVSADDFGFVTDRFPDLDLETHPHDGTTGIPAYSETASLPSIWHVPYQRNPFFYGRDKLLEHLHELLSRQARSISVQPYALCGLAGSGKTQIALEYVYRYAHCYSTVLWIQAETYETLLADFVSIARQIQLPGTEESERNVIDIVLCWLNEQQDWLLVLDHVEGDNWIKPFLPKIGEGALLLTTRVRTFGGIAQTITIPPLTLEEGTEFLLRRARLVDLSPVPGNASATPSPTEYAVACTLTELLGGLPLALDQAGAYIEETQCNLDDFLEMFQASPLPLLGERAIYSDYPHSLVQAFFHTLEDVRRFDPRAVDLLLLWPLWDGDVMPEHVLAERAARLCPRLARVVADPFHFNTLLRSLLARSLIHRDSQQKTIAIHPLLKVVLKEYALAREKEQCTVASEAG